MLPVRFHLPGLRYNFPLNMFWMSLLKTNPQYFREGVEIASCFGTFPYALWNGGRLMADDQCDSAFIKNAIKSINDQGVAVRYTFTNPTIGEDDLDDAYCNFLMDAANNGKNGVIVVSPILEKYLREKYPNFTYTSSTCKEIKDLQKLDEELNQDYKIVVLDYNLNNQWDILNGIEHKEKLEILVNPVCIPDCKRRGEHYQHVGRNQRVVLKNRELPEGKKIPVEPWSCKYGEYNSLSTIKNYCTYVSPEDIWEKYVPAGINNFKIEGRSAYLFSLIDTYCHYMIKPEYMLEARLKLIKNLELAGIFTIHKPRPSKWP